MAQTKNKRFKEQKRAQRKPAPQPAASSKKAPPAPSGGDGKKLLVGGGIVAALAAVITTVVLVMNPFGGNAEATKSAATPSSPPATRQAPTEMTAPYARMTLIRDYRASVEADGAEKIAEGCKSGKPVSITVRIRGNDTPVTITCKGAEMQVVDAKTKKPLESRSTTGK